VISTSTASVNAIHGRIDDDANGAIELFQPTQVHRLLSRSPLHSLELPAKPAC
jgi:hypothetical protein